MLQAAGKIGFVGGGNMAEAIIKGLLQGALPASRVLVGEPSLARQQALRQAYGVEVVADNRQVVENCELLVLAVKPQLAGEVLSGLAAALSGRHLLVSILAGVTTAAIEETFDGSPRVVRAMPNTPALVGFGATALCPGRYAIADDLAVARHLFEAVGTVHLVAESQMDAVTGLSGSGPAYVYTVIEALADGGVMEGLPRDVAQALAVQTVLGAAELVRASGEHPATLRDRVCSPGGTTIAAVKALEDGGVRATLMNAVGRAAQRSRELGGKSRHGG